MKGEIKRIHLDLAGDAGFRDFEVGDLIIAKQRTGNGMFTAEAEVFAVGEDWVQVKCNNDFPHTDRLDWVRVGNDTNPDRRAFITLKGSGDGSPRQEFRARIASWKDLKSIDTLVMLEGDLDGVQHPVMGRLEGDGVFCSNIYAIGKLWVKVGDALKETGAEFKVQADMIAARVTSEEYAAALEVIDREIAARVTSDHFESELKIRDNAITARVTSDDYTVSMIEINRAISLRVTQEAYDSQIQILKNSISLQVTKDQLVRAGIYLDGDQSFVDVRADKFAVTAMDGTKLIEASAAAGYNRVAMRNVDIVEGGVRWTDGTRQMAVGSVVADGSGETHVAMFRVTTATALGRDVAVKVIGDIQLQNGGIRGLAVKTIAPVGNYSVGRDDVHIICQNTVDITVTLPYVPETGRTVYIRRDRVGEVKVKAAAGFPGTINKETIRYANANVTETQIGQRGYTMMLTYFGGVWHSNLLTY